LFSAPSSEEPAKEGALPGLLPSFVEKKRILGRRLELRALETGI
jgi:hypothetical protein